MQNTTGSASVEKTKKMKKQRRRSPYVFLLHGPRLLAAALGLGSLTLAIFFVWRTF